jgi:predicted RNase H-like HicB family nuclease
MRLEGVLWKDKKAKYWVAYVPLLEITTQGTSKKNALAMIEDAVRVEIGARGFRAHAEMMKEGSGFTIGSSNLDALVAFMLRRQRTARGLTLREVARRLKSSSPSAYAQYEQGKRTPSLAKLRALLQAIDPKLKPVLKAG